MSEGFIVTNSDEFYSFFRQVHKFSCDKSGVYTRYEVSKEIGSGYMEQIKFDNGLEFCIADFCLEKEIQVNYNLKDAPFEVSYMTKGTIYNKVKNIGDLKLETGQISVLFKENMQGRIRYVSKKRIVFLTIIVHDKLLKFLLESCKYKGTLHGLRHADNIDSLVLPHEPLLSLKSIFQKILKCPFQDITKLMVLQASATEVIAYVLEKDFFSNECKFDGLIKLDRYALEKLEKARLYIEDNMEDIITIKTLSQLVGLNEYKLKAGFRKIHHMTIREYQKHCRMHKAYELMQQKDFGVTQAAIEVGYTNISHFAKCFREHYGENPKHFRFGV